MLQLINKDRQDNGLSPVILGNNAAAQKHAEERLVNDYHSHWGMDGLKPYMRYTLAGGFNYEAENGFVTRTTWIGGKDPFYKRDPKAMLEEAQKSLMGSAGHRRNILNKWHKKVNLGIAYNNESLHLVQQFEGDYIRFSKLPALEGSVLSFAGNVSEGLTITGAIQVWYDPPPHSLTLGQLGKTYAYNSGQPAAFVRSPAPLGSFYPTNETQYSWETQGPDPYSILPDTPSPSPNPWGISVVYPPTLNSATVKWVDATRWGVSGSSFNIEANLGQVVSRFGKGVYTVVIWAEIGNESVNLTNYSIFVR